MIGIYQDSFLTYLKENLGEPINVTSKNIITRCPFCEMGENKEHYHFYISTHAPIFHCFHAGCNESGFISKLFKRIDGFDKTHKFIDQEKIKESQKKIKLTSIKQIHKKIVLPKIDQDRFKLKSLYIKKRLKFSINDMGLVKNLVFDLNEFLTLNNIQLPENILKIKDFLNQNFVGFLSEHESVLMMRNIDENSSFKFYKLSLNQTTFLDYYKLNGNNYSSNHIIIGEGIFDIYNEQIFDYTKSKQNTKLYAACFSNSFDSLIKSIVFNERIYKLNVTILSDRGISLDYYKMLKHQNSHIVNDLIIYFNRESKDFGDNNVLPEKFIL